MNKIIIKSNNKDYEYDIIFTFKSKNTNMKYIVYTDYKKDENNNIMCYSGIYDNGNISKITTEEELLVIDNVLKDISKIDNNLYTLNK